MAAAKADLLRSKHHRFGWAKLMFIGQERAGKTSLLKNLTGQGFDDSQVTTNGADVCVVQSNTWEAREVKDAQDALQVGIAQAIAAHVTRLREDAEPRRQSRSNSRRLIASGFVAVAAIALLAVGMFALKPSQPAPNPTPSPTPDGGGETLSSKLALLIEQML